MIEERDWMDYGRSGDKIEIIFRDSSHAKLETFICNNAEKAYRALRAIRKKYGFR